MLTDRVRDQLSTSDITAPYQRMMIESWSHGVLKITGRSNFFGSSLTSKREYLQSTIQFLYVTVMTSEIVPTKSHPDFFCSKKNISKTTTKEVPLYFCIQWQQIT